MEDEIKPTKSKALLEFKDILAGVAFPFILTLVISSTILVFASYSKDLVIRLMALIGGEIMLAVSLVLFGRANGSTAYNKTLLHAQKRELGSTDETVVCRTGEYALWKGALIGFILCIPFIIFQIIELCAHNVVSSFCLQYMCGWAYYPFSFLGADYQALGFIMMIMPVGTHMLGYHLGKLKRIKAREAEEAYTSKKRRRK